MAGIKVVEQRRSLLRQRFLRVWKDKRFISILIVLIIALSLVIVAQEYHPTIYTNTGGYQLKVVSSNANKTFHFSTDDNYNTVVNVSFPAQNGIRYFIMINASYFRNGIVTLLYYPDGSGYQNHSFEFNKSNPGVSGNNYVINITSTNGKSFPVNVSYTIFISNIGDANPLVQTVGMVLLVGSVIALAVFFTVMTSYRKERRF